VSENQRAEVLETPYARQLTSGGGKPGQGYPMMRQGASVRRLTPTECSRLQSVPDTWLELESEYGRPEEPEAHATQVLRRLWGEAGTEAFEEWTPRVVAALLTPEVLLAGVHGGWISWAMAARRAAEGRALQGSEPWPEDFVRRLREYGQAGPSPHRRESFEQLARELGRSLSELPLEETQAVASVLRSRLWPEASAEWPLRLARPAAEAGSPARPADTDPPSSAYLASPDSRRYAALGDAVTASVSHWIGTRLLEAS
jgi:site-specific DNA-cytosine methylase